MEKLTVTKWLCAFLCFTFVLAGPQLYAQMSDEELEEQYDEQQYNLLKKGKKYFNAYINAYRDKHGKKPQIKLAGAELAGMNFTGYDFEGAIFFEADMRGVTLVDANLKGAILKGADMGEYDHENEHNDQNLTVANLTGADLTSANMYGVDLTGAKLVKANLCGVDLSQSSLIGANLRRANLAGARVTEADFEKVTADYTIFINCNNAEADNIDEAQVWENLILTVDDLKKEDNRKKHFHVDTDEAKVQAKIEQIGKCKCSIPSQDED